VDKAIGNNPHRHRRTGTIFGMAALFLAMGLLILLVIIGLAFYWQGSISLPGTGVAYGVEDSIRYITPRLSEESRQKIGAKSVRRILEWEMKYLQDRLSDESDEAIVLGGDEVLSYVVVQTAAQGFEYEPGTVAEVMQLQAEYMDSIGALSRPVADEEREALGLADDE